MKTENFVRIRVDGNQAKVDAMGVDGRIIDSFVLTGGPVVKTTAFVLSAITGQAGAHSLAGRSERRLWQRSPEYDLVLWQTGAHNGDTESVRTGSPQP